MDCSKKINLDGFVAQWSSSSPMHFFAEIVLIDHSPKAVNSLLYQLRQEVIERAKNSMTKEFNTIHRDDFTLLGEVISIDKGKKLIHLSNEQTISYMYLILVSTTEQLNQAAENEKLLNGLLSLLQALRVKEIPLNFSVNIDSFMSAKHPRFISSDATSPQLSQEIQNLIIQKESSQDVIVSSSRKCLYEVLL